MSLAQVAYLASSLFLDYKSDLIILVVNTITQDLKSDNHLVGERTAACRLPDSASLHTLARRLLASRSHI